MPRLTTILFDEDLARKSGSLQSGPIQERKENVSFSRVENDVLRKGLRK